MNWGLTVKTPVVLDLPGPDSAVVSAFVIDSYCGDNSGSATVQFQAVAP